MKPEVFINDKHGQRNNNRSNSIVSRKSSKSPKEI